MSGSISNNASSVAAQFKAQNGQILDPSGNVYTAKGINVLDSQMGAANQILTDLPGLNYVRLAAFSYSSPDAYSSFINTMTSHGVVVEIEDHTSSDGSDHGGSSGEIFSGQRLQDELNWYSSLASAYASNPYVWFGTDNEPPNGPGLSNWQRQTYDAIRNAGNDSPILMALPGGGWIGGQDARSYGLDPTVYASMSNIAVDVHLYGWSSDYIPDLHAVDTALNNLVNGARTLTSTEGTPPVIIGEYGVSTFGQAPDANAQQILYAAQHAGQTSGAAAFAWTGGGADSLTDAAGNFTSYGQNVAQWIAGNAGVMHPDTLLLRMSQDALDGNAHFNVTVDGQQVGGTLTAATLHSSGNSDLFLLTGNWGQGTHSVQIQFLNNAYGGSSATDRSLYVDSIAYDGNTYGGTNATLHADDSRSFTVGGLTNMTGGPADSVTVYLAEDAWDGDAQAVVTLDGRQATAPVAITASHAAGQWQVLVLSGDFGADSHSVGVSFVNDAYGGTPTTDRNLYVNGVDCNGQHYGSGVTALPTNGSVTYTINTDH